LVNDGFSEAAANTTIVPEVGEGWDDEGDFELHATVPASSIVDSKPASTPIRRMGQTVAAWRSGVSADAAGTPRRAVRPNSYENQSRAVADLDFAE
jgi:hypothetical protein